MTQTHDDNHDEWKTITRNDKKRVMRRRGRSFRGGGVKAHEHQSLNQTSHEVDDVDVLRSYIQTCQESLEALIEEVMMNSIVSDANNNADSDKQIIQQIVCYGIGNFSRTSGHFFSASLWQLALVLSLQIRLNVPLLYYDPCTTPFEMEFLEQMDIQVLSNNEKGERTSAGTFFFMPHCPSGLYENVLWSNWGHLETILILGNSLKSYSEAMLFNGPCIKTIQPWLQQDKIPWSHVNAPGDVEGAFNDTFLSRVVAMRKQPNLPERPYDTLRELLEQQTD